VGAALPAFAGAGVGDGDVFTVLAVALLGHGSAEYDVFALASTHLLTRCACVPLDNSAARQPTTRNTGLMMIV
jgi:hypothetical protein